MLCRRECYSIGTNVWKIGQVKIDCNEQWNHEEKQKLVCFHQALSFRLPVNGEGTSNYNKMGEGFETAPHREKSASLTNKQGISVRKVELHL